MNTTKSFISTQHHMNRIALLSDLISDYPKGITEQDAAETLTEILLPLFKSRNTLTLTLGYVGTTHNELQEFCGRFLAALERLPNESQ